MDLKSYFYIVDSSVAEFFSHYEFTANHVSTPLARLITTLFVTVTILYVINFIFFEISVLLGRKQRDDIFTVEPIPAAHIYVEAKKMYENPPVTSTYRFQFKPEDYQDNKDPSLGVTIGFVRRKVCDILNKEIQGEKLDEEVLVHLEDLVIYHRGNRLPLKKDTQPLCLEDVDTGDTLFAFIE